MCAICNFKIEFSVAHPATLTVAVATRAAIEAGTVEEIDVSDGALSSARHRLSAIETLSLWQARIEDALTPAALLELPDFYVLLIETDTVGFFHSTENGFDPDVVPEMPDLTTEDISKRSNMIVTSEAMLRAWMKDRVEMEAALDQSMLIVDAPLQHASALRQMLRVACFDEVRSS
jgi:hypothetical protein